MPLVKHQVVEIGSNTVNLPKADIVGVVGQEILGKETPKPAYTGRKASSDAMSKEEWAAKDRRIGRAGLYQAALQSVGVLQYSPDVRSFEDYLKAVRKAAEDGLKFVNETGE